MFLNGKCMREREVGGGGLHYMGQYVTKAERESSGERVTQQCLFPVMPHCSGTQNVVFGEAGLSCQVNKV